MMAALKNPPESEESSKKQRIVFVHPDLGIGGAERLIIDAAVGLQNRGHKVTIFTSHCDPQHCFDEARDGESSSPQIYASVSRPLLELSIVCSRPLTAPRYPRCSRAWPHHFPAYLLEPFPHSPCYTPADSSHPYYFPFDVRACSVETGRICCGPVVCMRANTALALAG